MVSFRPLSRPMLDGTRPSLPASGSEATRHGCQPRGDALRHCRRPSRSRLSRDHTSCGLHGARSDGTLTAVRGIAHPTAIDGEEQMNKAGLVSHVAAELSVIRTTAERVVGAVFTAIGDALARGEPAAIAGLGKFATGSRAARQGRNPRTREPVAIPIAASRAPLFKPAKALRDADTA